MPKLTHRKETCTVVFLWKRLLFGIRIVEMIILLWMYRTATRLI